MAEKKETKKTTGRAGRPKKTAEPKPLGIFKVLRLVQYANIYAGSTLPT